jgi:hypothetical protein
MADHKIKLILTVRTEPDLLTLKYNVGDTFTFTSDDGEITSQCQAPPGWGPAPMTAPKGGSFTTFPLPKEPFACNCGLTLPGGKRVGWPADPKAGNSTGGGN